MVFLPLSFHHLSSLKLCTSSISIFLFFFVWWEGKERAGGKDSDTRVSKSLTFASLSLSLPVHAQTQVVHWPISKFGLFHVFKILFVVSGFGCGLVVVGTISMTLLMTLMWSHSECELLCSLVLLLDIIYNSQDTSPLLGHFPFWC